MFKRTSMKKTALYNNHVKLNAKLVPFAGYQMPVMYNKINNEYNAVRKECAVFDVSHMGQIRISGNDAEPFLQKLTINNLKKIEAYEAQYSAICNLDGGIIDDLILLKFSIFDYILIVNASNKLKVLEWINSYKNSFSITIEDMNNSSSLIALQGPNSCNILQEICHDTINIDFYHLMKTKLLNEDVILSRTGYTGELGFEILGGHQVIIKIWDYFINQNVCPAGLAVRDILRLEMKYCLYGNDINESYNPLEAGLSWITDLNKENFNGKDKLLEIKSNKIKKKLCGFTMKKKAIPRKGYSIFHHQEIIGVVTSGTHSPMLLKGIGLGYIDSNYCKVGTRISIEIRGKLIDAEVVKTPFITNTSLFN